MDKQEMTTNELIDQALESLRLAQLQSRQETRDHVAHRLFSDAIIQIETVKARTLESQFDAMAAAFISGYELTHR